jgi:hypothetical protein
MNNLNKIKAILTFEKDNKDQYYQIDVIQRKKDNPHFTAKDDCYRIKSFYINNLKYLELRFEEIKTLCDAFNARAYISINKCSFEKTAKMLIGRISERQLNNIERLVKDDFESISSSPKSKIERKYTMVDVDTKDLSILADIVSIVERSRSGYKPEEIIVETIETKGGFHLITKPFDSRILKEKYPTNMVEVKSNNPTLLYISD